MSVLTRFVLKKKKVRDLTALNTSHLSTEDYTAATDEETIFSGNNSCVLSPEVTEGPYYVAGEYIRSDVTEDQAGVALHLEVQVLDITTCEPVTGAYAEIWRAYPVLTLLPPLCIRAGQPADTIFLMIHSPYRLQLHRSLRWRICPGQRKLRHGYLQPQRHVPPWRPGD